MLEVKNICKVYKTKDGKDVRALDDVSLKFPKKGLVFILGKSGSGKSTLLNMLGGLDKLDSGEIIIKGKSSKDFKQADFDSYRNTYLGFIFQEYNILNEFSVGANIGLALKLQGKKATKETINDILSQVDMLEYAQRKPNQLSGGQKQRVAIARALVKDPEIILADEPTGALDSKTGIQVFDTLKELSKNKLVIVVSHDREFAESYGDRVIELKDGKVISDIEKYISPSSKKSEAISIVDNKIIQIEKGYELTQEDVLMINEYLKQNNAIICVDEKSNRDLKKFARIDDFGNKECFKDTDENSIVFDEDSKFKLIKSRLPFKESFKIGVSSLKNKPIRLIISIILSLVAFTLFGLADTVNSYNKYDATVKSLLDSNVSNISFSKERVFDDWSTDILLSDSDISTISSKLNMDFQGVYTPKNERYIDFGMNLYSKPEWESLYYSSFKGFIEIDNDFLSSNGYNLVGQLPTSNEEIVISKYIYETFLNYGYVLDGTNYTPDNMKELGIEGFLNKMPYIYIKDTKYKLVGIIDTNFDYNHFSTLEDSKDGIYNYILREELKSTVEYGYHGQIFVKKGFIDDFQQKYDNNAISYTSNDFFISVYSDVTNSINFYTNTIYNIDSLKNNNLKYKIIDSSSDLNENEILVNFNSYLNQAEMYYSGLNQSLPIEEWDAPEYIIKYYKRYDEYNNFENSFYKSLLPKALSNGWIGGYYNGEDNKYTYISMPEEDWNNMDEYQKIDYLRGYIQGYYNLGIDYPSWVTTEDGKYYKNYDELYENYLSMDSFNYRFVNDMIDDITNIDSNVLSSSYNMSVQLNQFNIYDDYSCVIKGFYIPEYSDFFESALCVSDSIYDAATFDKDGKYAFAIHDMVDKDRLEKVVKWAYDNKYKTDKDNIHFALNSGPTSLLNEVNGLLETLSSVFLYVGIAFAVFSALLMTNYIATSISYKKRDIGILRALGAKSSDVFGIFFNEAFVIAIINFILSFLTTLVIVFSLNSVLRNSYNLSITILNFGIRQFILMLLISVFVAFISSFIPVYKIAVKKPIDAIRNS